MTGTVLGAEFCWFVLSFFFLISKVLDSCPHLLLIPFGCSVSLKIKLFGFCIGLLCWLCPAPLLRQGKLRGGLLRFLPSLFVREGDTVASALLTVAPVRRELLKDCLSSGLCTVIAALPEIPHERAPWGAW